MASSERAAAPESEIVESATEARNDRTEQIDTLSTIGILELINDEDTRVAAAVRATLPDLARVVDEAVDRIGAGGRVHYFGAGTSGRIAAADAAELPPTFSVEPGLVVAHHAGGSETARAAVEGIEDDEGLGRLDAVDLTGKDVAIGIAASGRTPYVRGALAAAADVGAFTVVVTSRRDAPIADIVDVHLFVDSGPEVIAGSTRLKAGTAQKLVVNSFSTALMVRLGKTYSNLMVDVSASNSKLRGRVISILMEATGQSEEVCRARLRDAGGETKVALVSLLAGVDVAAAAQELNKAQGRVRAALESLALEGAQRGEKT